MVSNISIFAPNFGEGSHFDVHIFHIFQRGRNHQLDKAYDVCWLRPHRIDESLQFRISYFNGSRIRDLSLAANGTHQQIIGWAGFFGRWETVLYFCDLVKILFHYCVIAFFPNQHYRHDMFVVTHSKPHIPKMSFRSWGIRMILDIF